MFPGSVAIVIRPTKIVRVAAGESPEAWGAALADPGWLAKAEVLKEEGGSWVRRATLLGRDVVVKCRTLNTIGRRIKSAIGMGHGAKHWRGAELLGRKRVLTARTWALARGRVEGVACELLVMECLSGPTLLECMEEAAHGRMKVRTQHAIARAAGVQMSGMGWNFNRDHKPSNLIVLNAKSGAPEVAVIDCVGVRFQQVLRTERMLASLVIEPIGCGVRPRRALMMRALRSYQEELDKWYQPQDYESWDEDERPSCNARERVRKAVRLEWEAVAKAVLAHGDPRPQVNPLGRFGAGDA